MRGWGEVLRGVGEGVLPRPLRQVTLLSSTPAYFKWTFLMEQASRLSIIFVALAKSHALSSTIIKFIFPYPDLADVYDLAALDHGATWAVKDCDSITTCAGIFRFAFSSVSLSSENDVQEGKFVVIIFKFHQYALSRSDTWGSIQL